MLKRTLYTRLFPNEARVDRYLKAMDRKTEQCMAALQSGEYNQKLAGQYVTLCRAFLRAVDRKSDDV